MDSIDTSGAALVQFWKDAGDKGDVPPATANNYRGAAHKVIAVLDGWRTIDVRAIDIEDVYRRFYNKKASKLKQGSLITYKQRWSAAVKSFLEYADNPLTWKPPASDKPAVKREKPNAEKGSERTETQVEEKSRSAPEPSGLIEYPFPLRDKRLAYLRLPTDLKSSEVERLTTFMKSLVMTDESK